MKAAIVSGLLVALGILAGRPEGTLKRESFDLDPGWEGINNRPSQPPREIRQDFGYSPTTRHAGGEPGEIGGFITPAAEPAYYAYPKAWHTFSEPFSFSGRLYCPGKPCHVLIGYFCAELGGWRTPNTLALRIIGRGDGFFAYVEYATSKSRAGSDAPPGFMERDPQSGRYTQTFFPGDRSYAFSVRYDPAGNGGQGTIEARIGDVKAKCVLDPGHKSDGATFNMFGILNVMKSADSPGEIWLDDLEWDGERESFERDPGWNGRFNRRTYLTREVRPWFDFGHIGSRNAQGRRSGELGGLVYRGDGREAARMAAYGDRLPELTLDKPLHASGRVSLRWAVSDSTSMIGFYHSKRSLEIGPEQSCALPKSFLGALIEGPSAQGFYFYPSYRLDGDEWQVSYGNAPPRIRPGRGSHDWSLDYEPGPPDGDGTLWVQLGSEVTRLIVPLAHKKLGARFDRFGIVTTRIDGNGQKVYYDDLAYTASQ